MMRSDRLKQVMQEIDPNFDEKDVGFTRFSKFVTEASQRGLLRLTRLDNGQYEVDLGSNANVEPGVEASLPKAEPVVSASAGETGGEPRGRRRRGGRERTERPAASTAPESGLNLADAFALLKRALLELGALGDESTDADQARERMLSLHQGKSDPIFETNRFHRFLRQAHDADKIELVKRDDDVYLLKLKPGQEAVAEPPAEYSAPSAVPDGPEQPDTEPTRPKRTRGGRGSRGGSGGGRRRGGGGERGSRAPNHEGQTAAPTGTRSTGERSTAHPTAPTRARIGIRVARQGWDSGQDPGGHHRRGISRPMRLNRIPSPPINPRPPSRPGNPATTGDRSGHALAAAGGLRKTPAPGGGNAEQAPIMPPAASGPDRSQAGRAPVSPLIAERTAIPRTPPPSVAPKPAPAPSPKPQADAAEPGERSLLKRMTAALQRAVKGEQDPGPPGQ